MVDDKHNYLGLFTERDFSRKLVLLGKNLNITIKACFEMVNTLQARDFPVIENRNAVGIIFILDVIEETSNYLKFATDNMESYIRIS